MWKNCEVLAESIETSTSNLIRFTVHNFCAKMRVNCYHSAKKAIEKEPEPPSRIQE
jgi:hypothetical protein